MFTERDLPEDLAAIREELVPGAVVVDCESDFETLPPAQAEDLGLLVDSLDPATYPQGWLPEDAPALLQRYAGGDFTIGMPGDGSVVWTRQTDPPVVLVKPRVEGAPDEFVDFLIAEALVELGIDAPEQFIQFFQDLYPDLDAAVDLDPNSTYQVAAALCDGWIGLHTRNTFAQWYDDGSRLGEAWRDAGDQIEGRLMDLPATVARGETDFADATELACSGIKHGIDLPTPFGALDNAAFGRRGADYAVKWAEKTFDKL
jgi:hypothetical protein